MGRGTMAFGRAEWTKVDDAAAPSAGYTANQLAGEIHEDIEKGCDSAGLPLFPASAGELSMDCSCPDYQVPCKHIAAAFYLLAEAFDEDPFAILAWRGRERDDLLANLHAPGASSRPAADQRQHVGVPLAACLDSYFAQPERTPVTRPAITASDSLLDQLPPVSVELRGRPLTDLLRAGYLAFWDV